MQIQYTTKSGSVYTRRADAAGDCWYKRDRDGEQFPLAGAMHLSRRRLQTLITDYPARALDRTACFGEGIAKEFFDDVKREQATPVGDGEESTIFFLIDRGLGQYSIGYSSCIMNIEQCQQQQEDVAEISVLDATR